MSVALLVLALAQPPTSAAAGPPAGAAASGIHPAIAAAPGSVIAAVDRRRQRVQLVGMATLTGWAIANITVGVAGNLATPPSDARYFHQMNALWNTVNLTLGAIGLRSALRERPRLGRRSRAAVAGDIDRSQRVFAINALLDVAYMLGGLATWELGKDHESARVRGYGAAVIFQGAFLMAFDLAMIGAHERGRRRLDLTVAPAVSGGTIGVAGRF